MELNDSMSPRDRKDEKVDFEDKLSLKKVKEKLLLLDDQLGEDQKRIIRRGKTEMTDSHIHFFAFSLRLWPILGVR